MVGEILRRIFGQFGSSNTLPREQQRGGHIRMGCAGELLEVRQLLSATAVVIPNSQAPVALEVANAKAEFATQRTIETPLGPILLTLHTHGTRLRGQAVLTPNDGQGGLGLEVSPIRFRARIQNLQLEGKLVGKVALPLESGLSQRLKGKFNVGPELMDPENLSGHLKVKAGGQVVLDPDFNVPLATLLEILQSPE
jgi:hypothetical protein